MRIATALTAAALLAVPAACGDDDAAERPTGQEPVTTPRPNSTPAPQATPEVGEELPESQSPPPRAKRFKGPTLRFDGARCTPESVRVGEGENLRVRNQAATSMRFQIPSIGLSIPVRRGESTNLLVPGGRLRYVCRSSDGPVARGVLDVAQGGG